MHGYVRLRADLWIGRKGEISGEVRRRQDELRDLENVRREIQEELAQWESSREPEPPRSDAVRKNRERLQEKGIPYQEFYKVVEFGQEMSGDPKRCGRLEEALLEMGILDALVIEEQYRSQVMEADPGCADRYLFVQPHYAEKSLLDVLDLNDSVNDIFMNQRITGILGNIALSERPEEAEDAGSGGSAHHRICRYWHIYDGSAPGRFLSDRRGQRNHIRGT